MHYTPCGNINAVEKAILFFGNEGRTCFLKVSIYCLFPQKNMPR